MNALLNVGPGALLLLAAGSALAQNGNMMNGGLWGSGWMGGYGGYWVPILLVVAVVSLVVWVVKQKGK